MASNQEKMSVSEISAMIEKEGLYWVPRETAFSALPLSEQKMYLGLTVTKAELKKIADAVKKQAEEEMRAFEAGPAYGAPVAKDWRNVSGKNYVAPVKDQGPCASGPCFDTCATIESNMRIKAQDHTLNVDLSEAFLLFCGGGDCMNG